MPKLVKRTQIVAWLNTTPSAESEKWSLIGNKTNDLSYSYNPQVNTEQSVVEDVADTSIDGYQPSIDGEMKCYYGDEMYDYINGLRYNIAIGDDAVTSILMIDKYDVNTEGKNMKAQVFKCAVSINSYGGAGGETPTISYTIGLSGNPTNGTATIGAGGVPTFTPSASE